MPDLNSFDPYSDKYADWQRIALSGANSNIVSKMDQAKMVANALGPQTNSGAFGNLPPESLLGLVPEQVSEVAKDRATQALQQMMTNMHALDFARKATGQDQADKISEEIVKQAVKRDVEDMKSDAHIAATKSSNAIAVKAMGLDAAKADANRKFDLWLSNNTNPKPTINQIMMTDYGKLLQKARAVRDLLGEKAKLLEKGNIAPETVALLQGFGMSVKDAIGDVHLAKEADKIFGVSTTPAVKPITLPKGITTTSAAIGHLMKTEGMSKEQAIRWIQEQ